jgi:hypothetical protein
VPRARDRLGGWTLRLYSWAIVAFSIAFAAIGTALIARTAAEGGGVPGFVLGGLFVVLGVARLTVERKRRGP